MKTLRLMLAIAGLGLLSSCGGNSESGVSSEAQTFCDCVTNPSADCPDKLKGMGEKLKDPKAAQAFLADVQKTCPQASKMLENMMPK